jgi:hypothetical protein
MTHRRHPVPTRRRKAVPKPVAIIVDARTKKHKRKRRFQVLSKWVFEGGTSITFRSRRNPTKEDVMIEMEEGQFVDIEIKPKNRRGGPGLVDGDIVWDVSEPTAGTLVVDETSLNKRKARFTAIEGEGVRTTDITASGDGKEGAEIAPFVVVGQVVVKDQDNTTVVAEMEFGPVQDPTP